MKRITTFSLLGGFCLFLTASTCFAQMYTVTDLGTPTDALADSYRLRGINASGQVVATSMFGHYPYRAFRTAPNSPINPATDDLGTPAHFDHGTLVGSYSWAYGINASGQVVGQAWFNAGWHAFRTAPNSPINPATDDLGTLSGTTWSLAYAINASGQVVGWTYPCCYFLERAFRTAPNSPINPATDDLGTLGGTSSNAYDINDSGQVVGKAWTTGDTVYHAFRTAPNSRIDPATDDLGTLGGLYSKADRIDSFGQVVGGASTTGNTAFHPFLYSNKVMHDLNNLIPPDSPDSGCELTEDWETQINDDGQISTNARCSGRSHAVLLNPIYKAFVQHPIKADGSSVFSAKRGVLPVKFTLAQYDLPNCPLFPATIAITRTTGETPGSVDESLYATHADSGSDFRIDDDCQYVYLLEASSLGPGTYRVDISINGIFVGHAVFALK
jgi:probable HAF family extracellular repeat protein